MSDQELVNQDELLKSVETVIRELAQYDPTTVVEILANVLIHLGVMADEDLDGQSEEALLDSIVRAKEAKGETLAVAFASQGLTMLTWVGSGPQD
jgi:hypothetical protein